MPSPSCRAPLAMLSIMLACLAGCASGQPAAKAPDIDATAEEQPEPLPKGVKPLTVEQEESMPQ